MTAPTNASGPTHDFPPEIHAAYAQLKQETLRSLEENPTNIADLRHYLHRLCGAAGMFYQASLGHFAGQLEQQFLTLSPEKRTAACRHLAALIRASQ